MPSKASLPKVYLACVADECLYYMLCIAQDGTSLLNQWAASRGEVHKTMRDHGRAIADKHYPQGWQLVDLTKLSNEELIRNSEFNTIMNLTNNAPPSR